MTKTKFIQLAILSLFLSTVIFSCSGMKQIVGIKGVQLIAVDSGWASNSVNAVIFRKNSLVSDGDTQFIAFYNQQRYLVLGKRRFGENKWILKQTVYKGNVSDAHNCISIMVDGDHYLHVAWDHHNNGLRYAKSVSPGSLQITPKITMTGSLEQKVSYPEFYKMSDGNLLFLYRDGSSGQGNLVIKRYDINKKQWSDLHNNLVDGQGQRNAYWQACIDKQGTIHLSWVWRETPDVGSNHDLCYARSKDGGITWEKSTGEKYRLPITTESAEYALKIPQHSELINQTSMSADDEGNPVIATYWRDAASAIPQYHIVYLTGGRWNTLTLPFHKNAFSLSGTGSKRIPFSRPQVMVKGQGDKISGLLLFRDEERESYPSVVTIRNLKKGVWSILDLTPVALGSWEPTYDTELWKTQSVLNLFIQHVEQVDGEGISNISPQMIYVLEWKPKF
ncbi:MAG: BNR repeat-containing protein [Candidatus Dadabacteria bacterium]